MTLEYIVKEAKEEGLEQGKAEGLAEGKIEMAKAMKMKNYPIEDIAELTGLTVDVMKKL